MALFDRESLQPGVKRRELAGWAMYDFANSGYTTVVLTAVFNAYFVGVIAQKAEWATLAWTVALSISCLLIMLTAPRIGAYADRHRAKKKIMLLSTVGCVLTTAGLATTQPGTVVWAMVAIIASNYFFSIGESLNGAFLPEKRNGQSVGLGLEFWLLWGHAQLGALLGLRDEFSKSRRYR
jgi:MFS transporter, UMF1 family